MKGNQTIIGQLNLRLIEELTGIVQYKNNRSLFLIWGYDRLVSYIDERIADETVHYEKLLSRIRFLDGIPVVGMINEVMAGQDVKQIHTFDRVSEYNAITRYNQTIKLCETLGDAGTRDVLASILSDEEDHIKDLDSQLIQISQITLQNYLSANL